MKSRLFAAAAAATTIFAAGSASADLMYAHVESFYSYGQGAPAQTEMTGFETTDNSGNFANLIIADGFHVTPVSNSSLTTGSVLNLEQAPTLDDAPLTQDPTRYLAVHAGGETRLSFDTPLHKISFYIGSFDSFDLLTFFYAPPTGGWEAGDGSWVSSETLGVIQTDGTIADGANNGLLTLRFDRAVQSITFRAGQNAFEISSISVPVPEPATWAMMIVGFGGVGALMRARRRQGVTFA